MFNGIENRIFPGRGQTRPENPYLARPSAAPMSPVLLGEMKRAENNVVR